MNRYSFILEEKINDSGEKTFIARQEDPREEGHAYSFPLGIHNCPYSAIIDICQKIIDQKKTEDNKNVIKPSDHDHIKEI
jgi:hypothetical protein